jgi:hypothetical protein
MSDQFNVTAAWDKSSYNAGDTITGTISGSDVLTSTSTVTSTGGPVTVPVVAADGAQSTVVLPTVQVNTVTTTTTPESVVIDTTRAIVDNGSPARSWVVSANKLSITATA